VHEVWLSSFSVSAPAEKRRRWEKEAENPPPNQVRLMQIETGVPWIKAGGARTCVQLLWPMILRPREGKECTLAIFSQRDVPNEFTINTLSALESS